MRLAGARQTALPSKVIGQQRKPFPGESHARRDNPREQPSFLLSFDDKESIRRLLRMAQVLSPNALVQHAES
jgi:hypothetical protein